MTTLVLVLFLLQLKHLVFDWLWQTSTEVNTKGNYGEWGGLTHSLKHAAGTWAVVFWFVDPISAFLLGWLDGFVHYHIDWAKQNLGQQYGWTPTHPKFWWAMGADQTAHQLSYLLIGYMAMVM